MARGKMMKRTNTVTKPIITENVNENVNTDVVVNENKSNVNENVSVQVEAPKLTAASYKPDDLIECRSMFAGKLLLTGIKTKMTYEFSNIGDVQFVEYQDLRAAMVTGAKSITAPYIIIEDEILLEDAHWKKIKDLYEDMYSEEDIEDILNLSTSKFKEAYINLPIGFKKTINTMVASRIENGTFDSVNKVKIIDEICGTDLKLLLQ